MSKRKGNSIKGPAYCRPEFRGQPLKAKSSKDYCEKCGFKIRGRNHEEGIHHKNGKDGKCEVRRSS